MRFDSRPVAVTRAPIAAGMTAPGAVLAAALDGTAVLVDTAAPLSARPITPCDPAAPFLSRGRADGDLLLGDFDSMRPPEALRLAFDDVPLIDQCVPAVGDDATRPSAVLGGDLLRRKVVRFELPLTGAPSISLWDGLPASDGALGGAGYAVLRFDLRGGAHVYSGPSSFHMPASRIVLRGCGAPVAFDPNAPRNQLCPKNDLYAARTGADLSLLLGTGVGPLVLTRSAWQRVAAAAGIEPTAGTRAPLLWGRTPVAALWVTVPRLALVNQQIDASDSPGPCAELGRARRIEWVERHVAEGACFQPCDSDGSRAETSAAYVEVGEGIVTAVVEDDDEIIAGASVEIGASEPLLDGIVGAGALTGLRFDVDYLGEADQRLAAACLDGASRARCWTAPSCPRLTTDRQAHFCFGLPPTPRAPVCAVFD